MYCLHEANWRTIGTHPPPLPPLPLVRGMQDAGTTLQLWMWTTATSTYIDTNCMHPSTSRSSFISFSVLFLSHTAATSAGECRPDEFGRAQSSTVPRDPGERTRLLTGEESLNITYSRNAVGERARAFRVCFARI